jgi:hypothetical protein
LRSRARFADEAENDRGQFLPHSTLSHALITFELIHALPDSLQRLAR